MTPMPTNVANAFEGFPSATRARLLELRELIFDVAAQSELVGELTETLKWGEPAYLTTETKLGTTIRLGVPKAHPKQCALYFNCNTNLVESFRAHFGAALEYEGKRAVLFPEDRELPKALVRKCVEAGLTYKLLRKTTGGVAAFLATPAGLPRPRSGE
ncbi:MAG: DUF1801 domain-containing protein [Myxococcota bacterium]